MRRHHVRLRVVADHHGLLGWNPARLERGDEHRRLRLSDHLGPRAAAGCDRGHDRAGSGQEALGGRIEEVRVGRHEACPRQDGADGCRQPPIVERGIEPDHDGVVTLVEAAPVVGRRDGVRCENGLVARGAELIGNAALADRQHAPHLRGVPGEMLDRGTRRGDDLVPSRADAERCEAGDVRRAIHRGVVGRKAHSHSRRLQVGDEVDRTVDRPTTAVDDTVEIEDHEPDDRRKPFHGGDDRRLRVTPGQTQKH